MLEYILALLDETGVKLVVDEENLTLGNISYSIFDENFEETIERALGIK